MATPGPIPSGDRASRLFARGIGLPQIAPDARVIGHSDPSTAQSPPGLPVAPEASLGERLRRCAANCRCSSNAQAMWPSASVPRSAAFVASNSLDLRSRSSSLAGVSPASAQATASRRRRQCFMGAAYGRVVR
jgi:hypothetical protein